ncbi:MAG: ABC transporter permease subunit [SAR324 cluster bacterium]|nr:ABC transporter permease subunit [SAR324 cluster bacterium]
MRINPLTLKKIRRFRSVKRGYYSFLLFVFLLLQAFFAELWINNRALLVYYEGQFYFPTYRSMIPGSVFMLPYEYETNYRALQKRFEKEGGDNFLIMPLVPYNAFEMDLQESKFPPLPPSITDRHFLGTDAIGRDMVARLVYGFRISIIFSILLLVATFAIGIALGCLMGYWGGKFDLFFQRLIEVWSSIPFLYIIMIIASIVVPSLTILVLIYVIFGWMGMTWYMRTSTYKEKARDYVLAARALGASNLRIIFHHILPNSISLIVTFVPFSVAGGISGLTALDFLGFGLPPPTPSWGELLQQGTSNLQAAWIVSSTVAALVLVMVSITFIGEGVREGFDPKMHSTFE